MKISKISIAILLVILTMGVVSATEGNVASNNLTVSEVMAEGSVLNLNQELKGQDILSEPSGSFADLQSEIDDAAGELKLTRNYIFSDGNPSVDIDKKITIDGNGFVIDGNNLMRAFRVTSDNVILKNIKFKNCMDYDGGGAVNWEAYEGVVSNCTFVNCRVTSGYGGAIYWDGSSGAVSDCTFVNCRASAGYGGAINWDGYNGSITNCNFVNCRVEAGYGGAISWENVADGSITNCNFISCFSDDCAGGVYWLGNDGKLSNCNFMNCSAYESGGAIMWEGSGGRISTSSFVDCYSQEESVAVYLASDDVTVTQSSFENRNVKKISKAISGGVVVDCKINIKEFPEINIAVDDVDDKTDIVNITFPRDASGTVEIFVNGEKAMVVGIVNGIASLDLSQYKDGNYDITFKYSGDDKYAGFVRELVATSTIVPKIKAVKVSVLYSTEYSVKVFDGNKAVSGLKVTFKIKGKKVGSSVTATNGEAIYKLTQTPGTYTITASVLGKSLSKKVTVKHLVTLKTATVKKSAKKLVLQATLAKVEGTYLKNKKITFKFNGKKYTAKTNKKGVAKVTIKSSVLKKLKVGKKVTYQATYLKDTVKKTVKVKK